MGSATETIDTIDTIDMDVDLEVKTTDELLAELNALLDRVADTGERIILTRDGKEVAALVHVDDARYMQTYMQTMEDRDDNAAAEEALAEVAEHGTIPWEVVEAELNSPPAG